MHVKAILVFASVVCEFGFSAMKEAKKERQNALETPQLDARLRILLLGPKDPNSWKTEEKSNAALVATAREAYFDEVSSIVNASIEAWNRKKNHNSKQVSHRLWSPICNASDRYEVLDTTSLVVCRFHCRRPYCRFHYRRPPTTVPIPLPTTADDRADSTADDRLRPCRFKIAGQYFAKR